MGDAYRKGNLLFQQGRYKLAIEQFQLELQAFPESAIAHAMLALALTNDKQNNAALAAAEQALRLDPELPFAHYAMGWSTLDYKPKQRSFGLAKSPQSVRRKQRKRALRHALRAMELSPDNVEFIWFVAALQFDLGRWFKAAKLNYLGLSVDPTYTKLLLLQILCFRRIQMPKRALALTDAALTFAPENADLHRQRGWIMLTQGNPRDAEAQFRRSLQLDPISTDAQRGLQWTRFAKFPPVRWVAWFINPSYFGRPRQMLIIAVAFLLAAAYPFADVPIGWMMPLCLIVPSIVLRVLVRIRGRRFYRQLQATRRTLPTPA